MMLASLLDAPRRNALNGEIDGYILIGINLSSAFQLGKPYRHLPSSGLRWGAHYI